MNRGAAIDRWPFTFRENVTKLIQYLEFDVGSSGRTTALSFLQSRYHNSIDALNAAWKVNATSFETIVNSLPFNEPSAQRFADYDAFLSIGMLPYACGDDVLSGVMGNLCSCDQVLSSRTSVHTEVRSKPPHPRLSVCA